MKEPKASVIPIYSRGAANCESGLGREAMNTGNRRRAQIRGHKFRPADGHPLPGTTVVAIDFEFGEDAQAASLSRLIEITPAGAVLLGAAPPLCEAVAGYSPGH